MLFSYCYTRKTKKFSTPQCLESSITKNHILNIPRNKWRPYDCDHSTLRLFFLYRKMECHKLKS